jgi:hypothetical protein
VLVHDSKIIDGADEALVGLAERLGFLQRCSEARRRTTVIAALIGSHARPHMRLPFGLAGGRTNRRKKHRCECDE